MALRIVRILLRFIQAAFLVGIFAGLANIPELVETLRAEGPINWPTVCWKIISITGPVCPCLVMIFVIQGIINYSKRETANPDKPWLADPQWAAKHIRLSNRTTVVTLLTIAFCYVSIAIPLAIATEKRPIQIFVAVVGVFFLLFCRVFWANRKWNRSELIMANCPGIIGGPFSGAAILHQTFPEGTSFECCLKCEHTERSTTDQGTESSQRTSTVWSSTIYINKSLASDPTKTQIPFTFAIPYDSPETSTLAKNSPDTYVWKLNINEKDNHRAMGASFIVPIFKTNESRRDFQIDDDLIAPFLEEVHVPAVLERLKMRQVTNENCEDEFSFRVWDTTVFGSILAFIPVMIGGIMAAFWFIPRWPIAAFVSLFPAIFLAIFTYVIIEMLFWKSVLVIEPDRIRFESGIAGFRRRGTTARGTDTIIECKVDYRKQNGEWWCLLLLPTPPSGEDSEGDRIQAAMPVKILKQLNGRAEAEAVQAWLAQQLGVTATKTELTVD